MQRAGQGSDLLADLNELGRSAFDGHYVDTFCSTARRAADDAASMDGLHYDDEANWTLDLPGGKRHLAETAWAAARREITEEALVEIAATATPRATVALGDKDMRCFVVDAATV